MNISIKDALRKVIDELYDMPLEDLRELLEKHKNGEISTSMREASEFIEQFMKENHEQSST